MYWIYCVLLIVYRLYTKNDYGLIYRIAKYDSQVSSAHDQATYDDSQVSYTKWLPHRY